MAKIVREESGKRVCIKELQANTWFVYKRKLFVCLEYATEALASRVVIYQASNMKLTSFGQATCVNIVDVTVTWRHRD